MGKWRKELQGKRVREGSEGKVGKKGMKEESEGMENIYVSSTPLYL